MGVTFSNEVIAISEVIADEIKTKYNREVKIIPNGVIIQQNIPNDYILKQYSSNSSKYILSVGRFVPEKGFHDLIEAFNKSDLYGYKLVIAGRADHEDKYSINLKNLASKNKNVILPGLLTGKALQELYSNADLFVLPSYYEGLPLALLEAMGYGLSCIASDIPPNRNVGLPDDRYFRVGEVKALTNKLKQFTDKKFSDIEKKTQINIIEKKYNWEKIAEQTLEVYRKVFS
jgi:glycosyltransferase involved in cell wall biosynthesis